MKIGLFAKKNKPDVAKVIEYLRKHFTDVSVFLGLLIDDFPEKALDEQYDIVVSYLSPWIIPASVLEKTRKWNLNFHPGPPEYPGIGCFNFAIYNGETVYGVTAHLMNEQVDTGKIVAAKRFPLIESDSVYTLSLKSYESMFSLFFEVIGCILEHNAIPESKERWSRKPYTRRELEELCKISSDMTEDEIKRKIKATYYPGMPGAYIEIFGNRFEYNPER